MIATFHHREFQDLGSLRRSKARRGLRISCGIPTLDEESTVGAIIDAVRTSGLVDEIVVVDSGSTDRTAARATAAGARFYRAAEVRPELGEVCGKGENLWKTLFVTSGDIILFLDADVTNPDPRFVSGLVGPLITRPELHYVKGFYERPGGGGRVTEILVRPLLRRFFPSLAKVRQPLAGEFAARRRLLEQLPFPVGYSVETTHLIDIARMFGTSVLGQTDLDERVHRRRPLEDLGRMSDSILGSVCERLRQDARWTGAVDCEMERPPAASIPNNVQIERPSKARRGVRAR